MSIVSAQPRIDGKPPTRSLASAAVVVLVSSLLGACTSGGATEQEVLSSFSSGIETYNLVVSPNHQGVDWPCLGISTEEPSTTSVGCPTLQSEKDEYATTVELSGIYFVVGYGLAADEEIEAKDAVMTVTTAYQGRRVFVIQLSESPGADPFVISVVGPEGVTRSITSYGIGS